MKMKVAIGEVTDCLIKMIGIGKGGSIIKTPMKIGIVCCSDGIRQVYEDEIEKLQQTLAEMGIESVLSPYIFARDGYASGTAEERANALMDFYKDDTIDAICDISGGDIANGILPYLDYSVIAEVNKQFWGYSDLTTVLNAIYAKTGRTGVLYQIRNVLYVNREQQIADVRNVLQDGGDALYRIAYHYVQGTEIHGAVVGGNIRCFLKLAGTEYMPDLQGKILLLESRSGTVARMETYLSQLQQIGAFEQIAGILLGTFTEMEAKRCTPDIVQLVKRYVGSAMPIAVTKQIGHGMDAKGAVIGAEL